MVHWAVMRVRWLAVLGLLASCSDNGIAPPRLDIRVDAATSDAAGEVDAGTEDGGSDAATVGDGPADQAG